MKATKQLNILKTLQYSLDRKTLEIIYTSFIRPIMEYGCAVWDGCTQADALRLESIQLAAARVISGALRTTSNMKLYEETGLTQLAKRRETSRLILMYKIKNNLVPGYLSNIFPNDPNLNRRYNTRQASDLPHFRARTELFDKSFFPATTRLWNNLPLEIRNSKSLSEFKSKININVPRPVKQTELYYVGKRFLAVIHARMGMGRSQLNAIYLILVFLTLLSVDVGKVLKMYGITFFSVLIMSF